VKVRVTIETERDVGDGEGNRRIERKVIVERGCEDDELAARACAGLLCLQAQVLFMTEGRMEPGRPEEEVSPDV
jgi:hypothetical protein